MAKSQVTPTIIIHTAVIPSCPDAARHRTGHGLGASVVEPSESEVAAIATRHKPVGKTLNTATRRTVETPHHGISLSVSLVSPMNSSSLFNRRYSSPSRVTSRATTMNFCRQSGTMSPSFFDAASS
jgi:hypothetical protein